MQDKVKLNEQELLHVAGGSDNKNSDTSKFECGNLSKKECESETRCKWEEFIVGDHCLPKDKEIGDFLM